MELDSTLNVDTPRSRVAIQRIAALPKTGKQLLKWYSHLSVWHRLILGALLGALGGSTFIGFLNTYAVYRYAFRYDARIPVEGVPYLGLAASILSFAFLFVALSCATLIYGLLRATTALTRAAFSWTARMWNNFRPASSTDREPIAKWLSIVNVSGVLSGFITALISLFLAQPFHSLQVDLPDPVVIAAVPVAGLGLAILSIRPEWVRWVAMYLTLALILMTSAALFIPTFYAARLRQIGYGGGTPVTLICENDRPCVTEGVLHLFLITSDAYLLYDLTTREFVEVPESEVKRIRYNPDLKAELPRNNR
jgi:hypothetical protein